MELSTETHHTPRLSPFAFPSNTTFRFVLLIVSVLGVSAFIYDSMFFTYNGKVFLEMLNQCIATAKSSSPIDATAYSLALSQCRAPLAQREAVWAFEGMVILLIVATFIYLAIPYWKIWRNHLIQLDKDDYAEIVAYLVKLCNEIGLSHTPIFLCDPLNRTISGLGFGHLGHYYVVLNGGLVAQFTNDKNAFRAVMLHELAHVQNADIDKTYFSVAIWQAFVIAALFPFAISLIFPPPNMARVGIFYLINAFLRFSALTILIYLIHKAVLRAREIYADLRASVYDGPTGSLDRILTTLSGFKQRGWWFLQAHPDPAKRRLMLADTSGLFRVSFWDAFATGVTSTIAFSSIYLLLSLLTVGRQRLLWGLTGGEFAGLGAALIFMPLVGGVIVVGIWREQFVALLQGTLPGGVLRLGFGLAAGSIFGLWLSPNNLLNSATSLSIFGLVYNLLLITLFSVFLLFLLQWVVATTSMWLRVIISRKSLRLTHITLIITGILLSVLIGRMYLLFFLGPTIAQDGGFILSLLFALRSVFYVFVQDPLTILCFIGLWVFPVASLFWNKNIDSTVDANWVFLDPTHQRLSLQSSETFPLRLSLLIGLVGGVFSCILLFIAGIIAHLGIPGFIPADSDRTETFIFSLFTLAALGQIVIGIIVVVWSKHLSSVIHGLFAAFVSGCIMTGGLIALKIVLIGGSVGIDLVWFFFSNTIGIGTFVTLPALLSIFMFLGWFHRFNTEVI